MLSVLIASHNGGDTIGRTLAALSMLDIPSDGWQLIVVNNASTDDTQARIKTWQDRLPLEYLEEPRLGKSIAMNKALQHAKGDFIVMTDDDVLPERNWLTEWRRVADKYSDCSVFGGVIVPEFDHCSPPSYVPESYFGLLYGSSHCYAEGEIGPMDDKGAYDVSGGNFAIRKTVYDKGNRLAEDYLRGENGLMGEDTEFVQRLAANHHKVGFAPNARVHHIVHERQTRWGWVHRRFIRHGRMLFFMMASGGAVMPAFPWHHFRSAFGSSLRFLVAAIRWDHAATFRQSQGIAYDLGALSEATRLRWRRWTGN